jgi:ubiquitin conjugation factor E4 B
LVATPGSSPFISDIFFLLQTYQHLGLNKTLDNRDRAEKNVKEFKKDLKRLEAEKAGWQAGVRERSQFDLARKIVDGSI